MGPAQLVRLLTEPQFPHPLLRVPAFRLGERLADDDAVGKRLLEPHQDAAETPPC